MKRKLDHTEALFNVIVIIILIICTAIAVSKLDKHHDAEKAAWQARTEAVG